MKFFYWAFGLALLSFLVVGGIYLFFFSKSGTLPFRVPGSKFLSSPTKAGISVISSDSSVVVWRDGPFLYKAKKGETGTVAPYAARGRVTKVDGRTFSITNFEGGQTSSVAVKLLESGDANLIHKKGEEIVDEKNISYKDITLNDKVEFHSLKLIGDNLYSSLQVFLIIS